MDAFGKNISSHHDIWLKLKNALEFLRENSFVSIYFP